MCLLLLLLLLLNVAGAIFTQHNVAGAEAYLHAEFHIDPSSQPFGHNTPTSQTGQTEETDNGLIA